MQRDHLGAGKTQAVVVGDSAIWVEPQKSLEDLVPNYPLLWAMLGVARPPAAGASLRGASEPDRVAWEYALGADTVQYLRTQGKSRTLYARVRHAGKTVGHSETTLSEDGRPTKAKLTVPSGPAKSDVDLLRECANCGLSIWDVGSSQALARWR